MCGRYYLVKETIETYLPELPASLLNQVSFNEIFPSSPILVKTAQSFASYNWGLKPTWSKQLLINARLETINEKPLFKADYQKHRCLILASGYYEWQAKTKYQIATSAPLIYLAGIYQKQPTTNACVIITQPASLDIAFIHERMPVILNGTQAKNYLAGADLTKLITRPALAYQAI